MTFKLDDYTPDTFVNVILAPHVSIPELEYFATVQVSPEKQAHISVPMVMALHPPQALPAAANCVPNCRVREVLDKKTHSEFVDLEYLPWLPAEKAGALHVIRVRTADIVAVHRVVRGVPEAELEELRRAEERKRMEQQSLAGAGGALATSPLVR